MGGEARTTVLMCPHSRLGTGGEPRPSTSKVKGPVRKGRDGGRSEDDGPHVPPQPARNRRRTSS
ncbi:hypothetical protein COCNU_06G010940 [Cocos nucifera]|uniref:Uncharacterized protein n=1 Tax=Cocos nucifera TaxID=13894 RepID=A0A8K0IC47_COCNU|nr:hypothetical protein COCNU_06G010940 [Cocos nucifera]